MDLEALVNYAEEAYGLTEERKWRDFPGFSVIADTQTKKWAALLIRFWDGERGETVELADLRSGPLPKDAFAEDWLSGPYRMHSAKWVGVRFTEKTREETVFRLFDLAIRKGRAAVPFGAAGRAAEKEIINNVGYTVTLDANVSVQKSEYVETRLPLAGSVSLPEMRVLPAKLIEMKRAYVYGEGSMREKAKNFYRQAKITEDYEDDRPWEGTLRLPYPTYHDLRDDQLRGYFTWRTAVRRGVYEKAPEAFVYIYLYELIHLVGVSSPEQALERLREFRENYLSQGFGDAVMQGRLSRWTLGVAVVFDAVTGDLISPEEQAKAVLLSPGDASDEALVSSLTALSGVKLEKSPAYEGRPADAGRLTAAIVRKALALPGPGGKDLFTAVFGRRTVYPWEPFQGAVWTGGKKGEDLRVELSQGRAFERKNGVWTEDGYAAVFFDKRPLALLARETDRRLRLFYKTGRALKANPDAGWCEASIDAVLREETKRLEEEKRPKISIDFSGLSRIRADAEITREALLTESDLEDVPTAQTPPAPPSLPEMPLPAPPPGPFAGVGGLTEAQTDLVKALLRGEDVAPFVRETGLPPSVVADALNDALFDFFGDSVIICENDALLLEPDYMDELSELFGGTL